MAPRSDSRHPSSTTLAPRRPTEYNGRTSSSAGRAGQERKPNQTPPHRRSFTTSAPLFRKRLSKEPSPSIPPPSKTYTSPAARRLAGHDFPPRKLRTGGQQLQQAQHPGTRVNLPIFSAKMKAQLEKKKREQEELSGILMEIGKAKLILLKLLVDGISTATTLCHMKNPHRRHLTTVL
ncbi:hypothetical protein BDQ17DRAFT_796995 [Cyathus striatus]|nr:hypothetical protein BDQ17DRAFT_796995 [Cyathus striatus]